MQTLLQVRVLRCGLFQVSLLLAVWASKAAMGATVQLIGGARQPQVVLGDEGLVHLTFGSGNSVYYAVSQDGAATFEPAVKVAELEALMLGMRRGPRIAETKGILVVSAIGAEREGEDDGNLFSWRSMDAGKTWHGPVVLNDVPRSARERLHVMAAAPGGNIFCAWLDLRDSGTQVYGVRSSNGGATWSKNTLVYKSPERTVCECCHPSVALDSAGGVYVMWRNLIDGNRDMFLATSHDDGETFEPAEKLGNRSWLLDGCPMDGGAIAVSGKKITTVWRRENEVFLSASGLFKEKRLGVGLQPWVASNETNIYSVWQSRGGKLYLSTSTDQKPVELASNAEYPVVATSRRGTGPAIVAWEKSGGTDRAIEVLSANGH